VGGTEGGGTENVQFSFNCLLNDKLRNGEVSKKEKKCQLEGENLCRIIFSFFLQLDSFPVLDAHNGGKKKGKKNVFLSTNSSASFLFSLAVGFRSFHKVCEAPRVGKNDSMW
jgi:hypothetical protein